MNRLLVTSCWLPILTAPCLQAQSLTWRELRDKFEKTNPNLQAAKMSIDESKLAEITAYLRPNPDFTLSTDGTQLSRYNGVWRPFAGTQMSPSISYLHERQGKRELRLEAAKKSTDIAASSYQDQKRGLLFSLRNAFVQTLQAKVVLENARDNLNYWDRELNINRKRVTAGDLAQNDMDRLELQRGQFESDYETATVNLRTAKIQLLMLLNDRTPLEKFDVDGPYEYAEKLGPLEEFRDIALAERPDLQVAMQNVELARTTHQLAVANGSTDPTFSGWWTHNPSFNNPYDYNTIGASISIPLRIFDRNQGEKARTEVDIGRNQKLSDAARAQVFNDVDSAYVTLAGTLNMLRPYKEKYLKLSLDIRNRVQFSFQNGGSALVDYLDAEKAYRDTRLAYVNLIGSYLTAAAQMNMAVGREVI